MHTPANTNVPSRNLCCAGRALGRVVVVMSADTTIGRGGCTVAAGGSTGCDMMRESQLAV